MRYDDRIEECGLKITNLVVEPMERPGGPAESDVQRVHDATCAELQRFREAETRRCMAIFKQYLSDKNDAWGPGASNPPDTRKALDKMLGGLEEG